MILVEKQPNLPELSLFVDRYQLFVIHEEAYLKTVPNGKIELYHIIKGGFNQWNDQELKFDKHNESGFLPSTNRLSFLHIPDGIICLNIKLNMSVLGLSFFENFILNWKTRKTSDLLSSTEKECLLNAINPEEHTIDVDAIDKTLNHVIEKQKKNKELLKIVSHIEKDVNDKFKVTSLANQLSISPKTLERKTKKHFNLSPKDLWQVIRFEHATSHIKKHESQRLIEAISFGYYDQSHFIKECKKVTGYTPTDFFSKLKFSTNDLIIENDNLTLKT